MCRGVAGLFCLVSSFLALVFQRFILVVSTFTVPSMPLIDVPEAAKADALPSLDEEFRTLLNKNDVAEEIQMALGHHKIRTISLFCRMASSEEAFRTWADKKLGLDGDIDDTVAKVMLTEAWSSATGRAETQQKVDDNARAPRSSSTDAQRDIRIHSESVFLGHILRDFFARNALQQSATLRHEWKKLMRVSYEQRCCPRLCPRKNLQLRTEVGSSS